MRRILSDVDKPDRPGLCVSRACRYWWLTAPCAGREIKRLEDVESGGADYALDAMRYGFHRIDWASDIKVEWRR